MKRFYPLFFTPVTSVPKSVTDHRSNCCWSGSRLRHRGMPPFGGGGEPCTLCSKTVYPAEKLKTSTDNVYHQKCFTCTKCKRGLQVSTYCEDAVTGRLYCKAHYEQMAKAAGIDAVARGVTAGSIQLPRASSGQSRAMRLSCGLGRAPLP